MTARIISDLAFMLALALLMAGAAVLVVSSGLLAPLRGPRPGSDTRPPRTATPGTRRVAVRLLVIGGCLLVVAVIVAITP